MSTLAGAVLSGPAGAAASVPAELASEHEPAAATVAERIERVRLRLAERDPGATNSGLRYRLAQWFNFNNFRQMPPLPFQNIAPPPPPPPFQNIAMPPPLFQNIAAPPTWRNF